MVREVSQFTGRKTNCLNDRSTGHKETNQEMRFDGQFQRRLS